MKILNSVSTVYNEVYPDAVSLQKEVERIIVNLKDSRWHYFSRIKTKDSFALKLETGRIKDPRKLEDLVAATIVVQNLSDLNLALTKIEKEFEIVYHKPKSENITHKESSDFPFDDLRLYLRIRRPDYLPASILYENIFELQIKTFLQHAWAISTHDLIYKGEYVSWAKERVAFQIRAMLEQAEIAISGAEELSKLPELAKENKKTIALNEVRFFLTKNFTIDQLPSDVIRLTKIILDMLSNFKISLEELQHMLDAETANGRGKETLDLSPYSILIESIKNQNVAKFESVFLKSYKLKTDKIFIPKEISMDGINIGDPSRIIST